MIHARVTLTCRHCGRVFERSAYRTRRADADAWERWAAEHITLCADCYHAQQHEETASAWDALNARYHFPPISGKSQNQIAYADFLRRRHARDVMEDPELLKKLERAADLLETLDMNALRARAEKTGLPLDWVIKSQFSRRFLETSYLFLTCTDSGILIDALQ